MLLARMVEMVALAITCLMACMADAQVRRPVRPAAGASKNLCVDVVSLRQGKSAKGLIIATQADDLLMVVERESFGRDQRALAKSASAAEKDEATTAWTDLVRRLREELESTELAPTLKSFYQQQLERAETELANLAAQPDQALTTRFLWLRLSAREISGVKRAPAQAQRVAVWAWHETLKNVESRDQSDLERELADAKIDSAQSPPDLSHHLAPRRQSDEEWAKRLAWVRYAHHEPLDFQGSGDVFVRVGDGAQTPDLAPLIQKMMSSNLESLLQDLDPTSSRKSSASQPAQAWVKSITPQADALKRSEFRATRLSPDPSGQSASVEIALVAKLPAKDWQVVWSAQHTTQASEISAESEQKIAEDPQVKVALSLLAALGAGAEVEVRKALRFGAATMAAQKAAQAKFFQARERYVQRLDGPPLP